MSSACISVYVMKFVKNYSLCLVINRPYNNKIKSSGKKPVCLIHWLLVILNVCFIVVCLATGDLKKSFEQGDNFFYFSILFTIYEKKILRKFSANITSLWKHKTPHLWQFQQSYFDKTFPGGVSQPFSLCTATQKWPYKYEWGR